MIKIEYVPLACVWKVDQQTYHSFEGRFRAAKVNGPARLMRLLSHTGQAPEGQRYSANALEGSYWFAEEDFRRIQRAAARDLAQQRSPLDSGEKVAARLGIYMRHQLRQFLAVRRDWTPSFDYYAILSIPPGRSLAALVGKVRAQPVYSPEFDGEARARQAGLRLEGGLTQYVIQFGFPENRPARDWIQRPQAF
ncbi:MAG: hypothetical protein U1G07_24085 [Verrucomicrobiota bacterium]